MGNKLSFIHLIRNPKTQYTTFKIVFSNISNFVRLLNIIYPCITL